MSGKSLSAQDCLSCHLTLTSVTENWATWEIAWRHGRAHGLTDATAHSKKALSKLASRSQCGVASIN